MTVVGALSTNDNECLAWHTSSNRLSPEAMTEIPIVNQYHDLRRRNLTFCFVRFVSGL